MAKWYNYWFDTPYYHLLYQDRDRKEAREFVDRFIQFVKLPKGSRILDLACGRGRHSIYLHSLGYEVIGADLSLSSIDYAKQFERDGLRFVHHDMCEPLNMGFDLILNLFTSFGYFEDEKDNLRTLKAIKSDLLSGGYGLIDFMNSDHVISNLVGEDQKIIDGICFSQKRWFENGYIIKEISFEDNGITSTYKERVRAFRLEDFQDLLERAELKVIAIFGNYELGAYDEKESERLILLFQ